MITVVGPTDLAQPDLAALERRLVHMLAGFGHSGGAALVRAGCGVPLAAARAAHTAGLAVVTVLPATEGIPGPLHGDERAAAAEMLLLSEHVRLLDYDPRDRDSCVRADEQLLRSCTRVLAVWDGSPTTGRDATVHLVAFARSHALDVAVLQTHGTEQQTASRLEQR